MRFPTVKLPSRPLRGRLAEGLVSLVLAAALGFILIVYFLALQTDDQREADQRQSLREAVEEARPVLGEFPSLEHQALRLLERSSGVKGLKLEPDAAALSGNLQSVVDRKGRIIGWLSFTPDRPLLSFLNRLWPLTAAFLILLSAVAGLLIWQLQKTLALLRDSDLRARSLEKLDQLTGLTDHRGVLELVDQMLAVRKSDEITILADFDLDRFKDVNDSMGHDVGDQMLATIGQRLRCSLPAGAVCGRLAGDEFIVVMNAQSAETAMKAMSGVLEILGRPAWISDRAVQVAASVGLVQSPLHGQARDDLIRRANFALRVAKSRGRGRLIVFDPSMDLEFNDRREIERELRRALTGEDVEVHYQPIVASEGSRIVGVEALARWNHPQLGAIGPLVFIPVAEQTGMMDALGEYVLRRALTDAKRWPELYVSVNVSPVQVRNRKFVELVARLLHENMISPSRLVLEMTESVLIDNPDEANLRLAALRGLGVKIALDDFGTGYSSLSYLQRFAFDKLKIDKAFVTPLGRSANSGAMIQAIVALGNALGLSILAEGVETEEQRVLLRLAGCHEMQGFLFAEPGPHEAIDAIVSDAKLRGNGRTAIMAG
jgi:diguanylate cyclase (GGDEF)-like protein